MTQVRETHLHLLENLSPAKPISFREQTLCTGRHRRSRPWKKYRLFTLPTLPALKDGRVGLEASERGCAVCVLNKYTVECKLVCRSWGCCEQRRVFALGCCYFESVQVLALPAASACKPRYDGRARLHTPLSMSVLGPQSPSPTGPALGMFPLPHSSPAAPRERR